MGSGEGYRLREETWTGPDGKVRLGRIWEPAPSTRPELHPSNGSEDGLSRRMRPESAGDDAGAGADAGAGVQETGQLRGVIALVHGLGEHSGRYAHLGEFLARHGFALVSADLGGFGRSGGRRGHNTLNGIVKEIDHLLEVAQDQFLGRPLFLYGHSLGGLLVLYYLLKRKRQDLQGGVVTSPGLRSAVQEQKAKVWVARVAGSVLPGLVLPSGLDVQAISRDSEVVGRYTEDPLVHDRISLGLGKDLMDAIPWIFAHASELNLPLLLMHGTADRLAFPRGSEEFAGLVPNGLVTKKLWPGMFHELHNEPEKDLVFAFLLDWLDDYSTRQR